MNRLVAVQGDVRVFNATSRTHGDRMFRRAERHSRLIRFLRIGIPVGIVGAVGLIVVAAYFNPFKPPANASVDPGKLVVSGSKIAMEFPRLTGFTNDSLPYELTARLASQDLVNPGVIELTDLRAQLQTKDNDTVEITARKGLYNIKTDLLQLSGNILVQSPTGYEARLHEATIDIKKGTIVSDHRVETRFPSGTLGANRLDVAENGAVVLFSQGVETILVLDAPKLDSAATNAKSK
jgi:lipopolysaccharide export system protein LptC